MSLTLGQDVFAALLFVALLSVVVGRTVLKVK
jgi:hypothetical protein